MNCDRFMPSSNNINFLNIFIFLVDVIQRDLPGSFAKSESLMNELVQFSESYAVAMSKYLKDFDNAAPRGCV